MESVAAFMVLAAWNAVQTNRGARWFALALAAIAVLLLFPIGAMRLAIKGPWRPKERIR